MLAIYKDIELRDYNERGLNYPMFGSVPPFQFESSYENTKVELIGDLTTEIPITVERDDGLSYYNGGYSIPLGTYYLKLSNADGDGQTYYSERFRVIDCVPERIPTYRDTLHLPLRFYSRPQPKRVYQYISKGNTKDTYKLPSFQIVTSLNTEVSTPTVFLCSAMVEEELTGLDIDVIKLDGRIYYIFYGDDVEMTTGEYYIRVRDGVGDYFSNWFGVGCGETLITFSNRCDIGGIYFAEDFEGGILLADTNIGEIDVDVFEEGGNDSAMVFQATDKKTTIRRMLGTNIVGEHVKDFLRRLRYFDEVHIYHKEESINARIVEVVTERMGDGYICNVQFEEKGVVSTVCECKTEAFTVGCVLEWTGAGLPDGFSGNVRLMDDGIEPSLLEIRNFYTFLQDASLTFSQLSQPVVLDFSEITIKVSGDLFPNALIEWSYTDDFAESYTTKQTDVIREAAMVYVRISPPPDERFITTWGLDEEDLEEPFVFPTAPCAGGVYDYYIDWDDGSEIEHFTDDTPPTHEYATAGEKTIRVSGSLPRFGFVDNEDDRNEIGDPSLLLGVDNFGNVGFRSMAFMFYGVGDIYVPNILTGHELVTDMSYMFAYSQFNGDISEWVVSSVTNMRSMFEGATDFNGDISGWDVSSVTSMRYMFGFSEFNGDISGWDVSSVTDMSEMFAYSQFDGDISEWDVSNVTSMEGMFENSQFDGDISEWVVSSVTNMSYMFAYSQFDGDISEWDVSNVTSMEGMFENSQFDGDISEWVVSSVTNMDNMFMYSQFNGDISEWNVGSVTSMELMFYYASLFNQDLSGWCVEQIQSEPSNFAIGATAWVLPKPDWGAPCS